MWTSEDIGMTQHVDIVLEVVLSCITLQSWWVANSCGIASTDHQGVVAGVNVRIAHWGAILRWAILSQ